MGKGPPRTEGWAVARNRPRVLEKARPSWNPPGPSGWSLGSRGGTGRENQGSEILSPTRPWCSECTVEVLRGKKNKIRHVVGMTAEMLKSGGNRSVCFSTHAQ